jgi:hypothetical protein
MNTQASIPLAQPVLAATPDPRPLSAEVIELARYRVVEAATEHFVKRVTFWLTVFGVIAGLLTFVGISSIKTSVSKSVQDDIKANLDRELAPLTDRARKEMVDNDISIAEIKKQSDQAQAKLDTVDAAVAKMDALSASTAKVNKEIQALNDRLVRATEQTNQAIATLRSTQQNLIAGRPSIFSFDFGLNKQFIIEGTNFGTEPGTLSIRVAYRHELTVDMTALPPPLKYTDWIPVDAQSVQAWTNTRITVRFSDAFKQKYRQEFIKLNLGPDMPGNNAPPPPEVYDYRIQTKSGAINEIR